jgi:very-short-patch-repair endonuclease
MPEKVLWNVLKNRQVAGLKFRREFAVGPYFGDFVCPEAGLIVELDGQSHEGRQARDAERTAFLESQGYRVFRVTNDDVLDDVESVATGIARAAGIDVVAWLNGKSDGFSPRPGFAGRGAGGEGIRGGKEFQLFPVRDGSQSTVDCHRDLKPEGEEDPSP